MTHILGQTEKASSRTTISPGGPSELEKGMAASLYNVIATKARRIVPGKPLSKAQAQGVSTIINALRAQRDAIIEELQRDE